MLRALNVLVCTGRFDGASYMVSTNCWLKCWSLLSLPPFSLRDSQPPCLFWISVVGWVGNVISDRDWVMNWEKPAWVLACVLLRLCFVKGERYSPHLCSESEDMGQRRAACLDCHPPLVSLCTPYPPRGLAHDSLIVPFTSHCRWPAKALSGCQGNKDLPTCAHHSQKDVRGKKLKGKSYQTCEIHIEES